MVLRDTDNHLPALKVRKQALEQLLSLSGRENLSETLLLTTSIKNIDDKLEKSDDHR